MISSLENIGAIIILLICAVVLEHIVAWAGSVLHSVPSGGESKYAVFTFRADQDKPLTTNVLMNILIPNVVMIFIYMIAVNKGWEEVLHNIIWFVVFFFIYRFVLICILLRRKELFHIGYECIVAGIAILIAYILNKYFFVNKENIFIPVSELRNELWIAIFLVLYKFVQLVIDKWVTQKKIITEPMIYQYITRKFRKFHSKYNHTINITLKTRYICILLYSIMIFEDYNRGPLLRVLERIKFVLTGKATLGIMQVSTENMINDEESIELAFAKLCDEIVGEEYDICDDMQIHNYAWEYNNDNDYAKSVAFIFSQLLDYLNEIPRWREEFYLREELKEDTDDGQIEEVFDDATT